MLTGVCQGFRHTYHDVLGLVATYAMAYDCVVRKGLCMLPPEQVYNKCCVL